MNIRRSVNEICINVMSVLNYTSVVQSISFSRGLSSTISRKFSSLLNVFLVFQLKNQYCYA